MTVSVPKCFNWQREVILPDSRFARIYRPLTAGDTFIWQRVCREADTPDMYFVGLMSSLVKIDDVSYDIEYYSDMEYANYVVIEEMFKKYLIDVGMIKVPK